MPMTRLMLEELEMMNNRDFTFRTDDGWQQASLLDLLTELQEYFEPKADIDGEGNVADWCNVEYTLWCKVSDAIRYVEHGK
jgi:hypothetical protein